MNEEEIHIAAYLRLSKAAPGREESNSIFTQRLLIRSFAAGHFTNYRISEYVDDGFSGTDFSRPDVQRLLDDARNRRVDCIIVKDFSRFGRDYIELGTYLEHIFPFLGVRFISINDGYDSMRQGGALNFDVNFKNLLYDLYSKDLSRKVKTSLCARKDAGLYVSACEPFGYEKSPHDRHRLIVCQDEAEVIRTIFSLTLQGMSSTQIAKKLNAEHVLTPIEFKIRKGRVRRKPRGERFLWSASGVCSILRNPVYTGDIAYGKTEKERVGGPGVLKPRSEWKIIREHHEPIISRDDFERVQKSRGARGGGQRSGPGSKYPLAGRVVCHSCGRKLRFRAGREPYFACPNRDTAGQGGCVEKITVASLEKAVLRCLLECDRAWQKARDEEREGLYKDLRRLERERARWEKEHVKSYRRYGVREEPEFHSFREKLNELERAQGKLRDRIGELDREEAWKENVRVSLVEHYIEEITVYDGVKGEIKVTWKPDLH